MGVFAVSDGFDRAVVRGSCDDGVVRLEDSENPDAWIEAEYRDGWVGRKLLTEDKTSYKEMIHPYQFQCAFCREFHPTELWGADQPYCPHCEQWHEFALPDVMAWLVDGEPLGPEETEVFKIE